jgi:uncharacterized membrane protein
MTWLQRYRARHYFNNSIWILPVLSTAVAVGAGRLLHWIDREMAWSSSVHPDTARAVLGTLASSLFTSIVFVCTALLVAVQLASAALTPRIIALVFRDPITRFALTLFVFNFTFSLAALLRISSTVPLLTVQVAAYLSLVSMGVFFYLISHLGQALRPSGTLRTVASWGKNVIESVYPLPLAEAQGTKMEEGAVPLAGKPSATISSPLGGMVLAFDEEGLLSLAGRADCVIEIVPQVGDFVAAGNPLFRLFPGGAALPAGELCQSIALGQERTLEQDPTYAFRLMVDIACKALSPAINDPTTAVLALDQIHHLLHVVGTRNLSNGQVRDRTGRLRLVYRTPDWEDFVHLAVTEIRHFGRESIQITRRLRAMLESLLQTLPEARTRPLREELVVLRRSAERFFPDPDDLALATTSDFQGVGGKREEKHSRPA